MTVLNIVACEQEKGDESSVNQQESSMQTVESINEEDKTIGVVCSPSSRQLKKIKSFPARLPSQAVAYAACSNIFSWNSFGVRTPKFR
jgi:hypothetical protein